MLHILNAYYLLRWQFHYYVVFQCLCHYDICYSQFKSFVITVWRGFIPEMQSADCLENCLHICLFLEGVEKTWWQRKMEYYL